MYNFFHKDSFMRPVSSWGRVSSPLHRVVYLDDPLRAKNFIISQNFQVSGKNKGCLPYGMGRSYGDSCLNPQGTLLFTRGLNHFISFDAKKGRLVCEAGVSFKEIHQLTIPRGWTLPVITGTQFITVGGAIANDVSGRNHYTQGSFGNHVHRLKLIRTSGEVIECSPQQNKHWFKATVGGLGLTGLILEAEIQLQPIDSLCIETETIAFSKLDDLLALFHDSNNDWTYTTFWLDCTSFLRLRGILFRGRSISFPQAASQKPVSRGITTAKNSNLSVLFTPPISIVNRLSLLAFNTAYYHLKKCKTRTIITHYDPSFYPLDQLLQWNRMYGPKGFFQHQSVIPVKDCKAIQALLHEATRSSEKPSLAAIRIFGHIPSCGMLSFPQPGITTALDFPNKGKSTLRLFERMDHIVRESGGRICPAKDIRMPQDIFEAGYPQLQEFLQYRDPGISSGLSRRLMGG